MFKKKDKKLFVSFHWKSETDHGTGHCVLNNFHHKTKIEELSDIEIIANEIQMWEKIKGKNATEIIIINWRWME